MPQMIQHLCRGSFTVAGCDCFGDGAVLIRRASILSFGVQQDRQACQSLKAHHQAGNNLVSG
jgi:hypothetical protein